VLFVIKVLTIKNLCKKNFNFVFKQDEGKFAATFIDIKVQGACFNG